VTYIAFKFGLDSGTFMDASITPDVPVVPEIVQGFVAANEGLRTYSPGIAAAAVGTHAYSRSASGEGTQKQMIQKLSAGDYSGTDSLGSQSESRVSMRRTRAALGGLGVAALAVLITGGSSGVEREVSNGPLRAVDGMFDTLAGDASHRGIVLQGDSSRLTFMDDSYISRDAMEGFIATVSAENKEVTVFPVGKSLPNFDGEPGIMMTFPDALFAAATGTEVSDECTDMSLVLDDAHDAKIGENVHINGVPVEVVDKTSGLAQMNRHVGVMPEGQFDKCIRNTTDGTYFGAVLTSSSPDGLTGVENMLPDGTSLRTQDEFRELNLSFWQKNVTPVLFQLIAWSGVFAVAAVSGERRSAMLRNMREIGTLHAQGVSMSAIAKVERAKALSETLKATALAAPFMPAFAAAFNAAEMGLKVGVGIRELSVGLTVTLAAKMGGSMRAVRRFGKDLPGKLAETVKG
jgi:hypothetical protein